jgi:carbamoyl-phosphate synthase large subunit
VNKVDKLDPITVLVTGAGGHYGRSTIANLKKSKLPIQIIAADSSWTSFGLFEANKAVELPSVSSSKYDNSLMQICKMYDVEIVFIGSGKEVKELSKRRDKIDNQINSILILNSTDLINITNDKFLSMKKLNEWGFKTPQTFDIHSITYADIINSRLNFPMICKPRYGSGSEGVEIIYDRKRLDAIQKGEVPYVVQELIGKKDDEYTVGIIGDEKGKVFGSITLRRWLKNGYTVACETVDNNVISKYAEDITARFKPRGYLNIQLRLKNNEPCAFEINGRISSTTGFRGLAGFNEPEMIIQSHLFKQDPVQPTIKNIKMLRSMTEYIVDEEKWKKICPIN